MDGSLIAQYAFLVAVAVGIPLFTVRHLRSNPAPLAIGIRWERRIVIASLILFAIAMVPIFIPIVVWLLLEVGWLEVTANNFNGYEHFRKAIMPLVVPAVMSATVFMGVLLYFTMVPRSKAAADKCLGEEKTIGGDVKD